MIESDGETREVEIPVRTELNAHGIRDNGAHGILDLLDGFHDQDSEMAIEDVPAQRSLEVGFWPETVVVWRTVANLKGKPVAGQAEVADETEVMLGPCPVRYVHSPLCKKFNLISGGSADFWEVDRGKRKPACCAYVERRGGCVIASYTPRPPGSQGNSYAWGNEFPETPSKAGMPPSASRVCGACDILARSRK